MNAPENTQHLTNNPGGGYLPIHEFYTPEYYELEKERIFKKSWLRIGTEKQVINVGDYFVRELPSCDTSLVVVRGRDQRIRAFHNMCSHRSNRIAYEPAGNTTVFKCKFHAWAYGIDGSLRAIPEENLFPGLIKDEHGLTEVACDTWGGFIWINVDPNPAQSLREYLGEDIYNGFGDFFERHEQVACFSAVLPVNWKICLDAFVETYHFSVVHAATAANIVTSREFPNGKIDALRLYEKHRIVSTTANLNHVPSPAEALARKFNGNSTFAPDESVKAKQSAPQMNPLKLDDWMSELMVIFPMFDLHPLNGFYTTHNYWPIAHDKMLWEYYLHMTPPKDAAGAVAIEYNVALLRDVVREDVKNLEMIQSNLKSGAKRFQILGEMEALIRHSYKVIAEQVGRGW